MRPNLAVDSIAIPHVSKKLNKYTSKNITFQAAEAKLHISACKNRSQPNKKRACRCYHLFTAVGISYNLPRLASSRFHNVIGIILCFTLIHSCVAISRLSH